MASLFGSSTLAHGCSSGEADSAGVFITKHQTVTARTKGSPYELSEAACCVFELGSGLNSSEAVQQEQYFGCVYQSVIIYGSTSIALK